MSIFSGKQYYDLIDDIYIGKTRITKVYDGSKLIYMRSGLAKFVGSLITGYLAIDKDNIYVFKGAVTGANDPVVYKIDRQTKQISKIIEINSNEENMNVEINCSLYGADGTTILVALDGGKKYMWYNKETNTCSEVYDLFDAILPNSSGDVYGCVIDATHTYFILSNTIVKVENGKTFGYSYSTGEYSSFIDDNNYIYLYTEDGTCHRFDKTKNVTEVFGDDSSGYKPNNVSAVMSQRNIKGNVICQNSNYVFQVCKNTSGKYNQILVTDKFYGSANHFDSPQQLTVSISELESISGIPTIACTDKYLFVCYGAKVYIFNVETTTFLAAKLDEYTTVDFSAYVDGISSAVGDSWTECLYIRDGLNIFKYKVPPKENTSVPY